MQFIADHYFQIGNTHYIAGKPCQDHAMSRSTGAVACGIVSDGCSTGGETDIGARIVTCSTLQAIRDYLTAGGLPENAVASITARQTQNIQAVCAMLGMQFNDMFATGMYMFCTEKGGVIHVQGDGVVVLKYRSGNIEMIRYDWKDNRPFYPSYNAFGRNTFIADHGGDVKGLRYQSTFILYAGGIYQDPIMREYTLEEGIHGISRFISQEELENVECMAIFTDGMTQIENVDWQNAVTELMGFKSSTGEFLKRRMIRGLKDMLRHGKGPVDDIAGAVIHMKKDIGEKEVVQA